MKKPERDTASAFLQGCHKPERDTALAFLQGWQFTIWPKLFQLFGNPYLAGSGTATLHTHNWL
jgi:hypothetical protein